MIRKIKEEKSTKRKGGEREGRGNALRRKENTRKKIVVTGMERRERKERKGKEKKSGRNER